MGFEPATLIDPLNEANTAFLDSLGDDCTSIPSSQVQTQGLNYTPLDREIWNFDIDFETHHLPPIGDSNRIPSSDLESPLALSTPHLTTGRAEPADEVQYPPGHAHMPTPLPSDRNCSCLGNLYLALDSLGRLPTEVGAAIRVARCASKAAHDAVQCQICSPPITETMKVPISALQNTMILGALFPSIADAYQRIIDMVELETARAIGGRRQLRFDLPGYGGFWGPLGSFEYSCHTDRYKDAWMEPAMWRLTVRALLKMDVYGVNCKPGGSYHRGAARLEASHLGLKDIIAQMDERSRLQHANIDAMIEAGLRPPTGPGGIPVPHSHEDNGEEPHCRRIIKIAREAVDRLVVA
ncbi:hypothetical protein VPNG_00285 [Cytospora leucostoma]|uniref:Uncharacterized protein n=1 Tax=Cytospora leucostoma TaxID=1230097 RepID=A0A423XNQ2_9PEZI|nr:hypothetical protein VPNG_00285 [Cytospora leucostoma]